MIELSAGSRCSHTIEYFEDSSAKDYGGLKFALYPVESASHTTGQVQQSGERERFAWVSTQR